MSLRSLLERADKTQPNVEPLRTFDTLADAVRKAERYRIVADAEEAKCMEALDHATKDREEAERIWHEAKELFAHQARDVLGIKIGVE